MKLYYFNPQSYGTEYTTMAENKEKAIEYVLNHLKQTEGEDYYEYKAFKEGDFGNYIIEEYELGKTIETYNG